MIYLKLIRVHQYTKNFFVFAALFFSGQLLNEKKIIESVVAFICFCLIASAIYIINDLKDVEKDKLHPVKKNRPLASGKVSKTTALIIFFILALSSLSLSIWFNTLLFFAIASYFIINLFYCFGGKHLSIVDVFIIATGFVLRVVAGGIVTSIDLSHWLIIMTFLLALFIAFAKRRDDILIENETGIQMRNSVNGYNLEFITAVSGILNAVLIVCYIMYVTSSDVISRFNHKPIYLSTVFVLLGLFRYLQISIVEKNSGSPSKLVLKDTFLKCCIVGWVLFFVVIIYFKNT